MNAKSAISVCNVSKRFKLFHSRKERLAEALHPFKKQYHTEFWAVKDISFDVGRGEIVGVLGRNGSGKTTLLQIMCSVMTPTNGDIQSNGRISALLGLGVGFNPDFTGRNNALLNGILVGIPRQEMLRRIPAIEAFADIGEYFDQPMRTYSSGMFMRVGFAAAIFVNPDILVIDEVLGVGDIQFQEKCFRKISEFKRNGVTIILVTHSTNLAVELCDKIIVLDSGNKKYSGDPQRALRVYEEILFPHNNEIETVNAQSPNKKKSISGQHENQPEAITVIDSKNLEVNPKGPLLQKFLLELPVSDQCQLRRSYNINEFRFGEGGGEIVDYLVIATGDHYEEDPVLINSGTEVHVYIKVLGKLGISKPTIGIGLFTPTGLMVSASNSRLLKIDLLEIEKGVTYIYRIKFRMLLLGGVYFVHFGLTEERLGQIVRHDARQSLAMIRVEKTAQLEGLADISMQLEELKMFPRDNN
jgi:lipopolysaccharide transport system ATP-binding protein